MNVFEVIGSGIKRIFFGKDALFNYISLFALVGMMSVVQTHFELLKDSMKDGTAVPDFQAMIVGFIVLLVIGLYFCGYSFRFMHNAYNDNCDEILPTIDEKPFGTFFGAFPLMIVWVLWVILTYIVGLIPILGWIGLLVMMFIWYPFIQFVFVAYSRYFNSKGLFRYTFPIDCMKPSFWTVVRFGLAFILLWLIALIPCGIAMLVVVLFANGDSTLSLYLCGILIGYFGFLIQMLWNYCAVQVYREVILTELYEPEE